MRVLVIDDEPTLLAALRRVLSPGHEVTEASDGERALELLDAGEFDLILCDLMLAGLEGVDVFERAVARRPELEGRFLFMTGGALTPRSVQFKAELGDRCIDKPFDARTITAAVRRFSSTAPTRRLRPRRAARAGRPPG
ncbi:MAG: hypothetical protein NVSMB47_10310 [Polyangiales bacterium]